MLTRKSRTPVNSNHHRTDCLFFQDYPEGAYQPFVIFEYTIGQSQPGFRMRQRHPHFGGTPIDS